MARTALAFGLAGLMVFFLAVKTTRKDKLLPIGSLAPVIHATTMDGEEATLDFQNDRTVLWVSDPTDGIGMMDASKLVELFGMKSAEYRFVGLSLGQADVKVFARLASGVPVYVASSGTAEDYGSWRSAILVIGRGGTVERKWIGFFDHSQSDIEQFFHVTFTTPSRLPRHNSR